MESNVFAAGSAREDVGLREPFLMQKRPTLEMNLGLSTESKLDSSNHILWSTLVCTFFRVFLCEGLIDKIHCNRSRNRNTLVTTDDHGIDANHFALCIDQRSAGVA